MLVQQEMKHEHGIYLDRGAPRCQEAVEAVRRAILPRELRHAPIASPKNGTIGSATSAIFVGQDGLGPWEIPDMRDDLSQFVET